MVKLHPNLFKLMKILIIIIALISIFVFLNSSKIYTYTCLSCHNPKRYINQKERSLHAGLECVECHKKESFLYWIKLLIPTIFQRAKNYDRHFSVTSVGCAVSRCHDVDKITTKSKSFYYDHNKHLKKKFFGGTLLCQNCHTDVAHTYKYKASKYICFLCHKITTPSNLEKCIFCHKNLKIKKDHPLNNCDLCHKIENSDIKVSEESCLNCHTSIRTNFDNLDVLHEIHKKSGKITCFSCHNKTIHRK